jgi:phospholipid-translocating ATPase
MGIVVRDTASNGLSFLQKGADVVMARIVQRNDWLEEETANMAREGLRTLVVARRKLSEAVYADFKERYHAASVHLEGRNEVMAAVVTETLERDLELLGLTGVEDKLQDDVRGTLELLRASRFGCSLGTKSRRSRSSPSRLSWSLVISTFTRSPSVSFIFLSLFCDVLY